MRKYSFSRLWHKCLRLLGWSPPVLLPIKPPAASSPAPNTPAELALATSAPAVGGAQGGELRSSVAPPSPHLRWRYNAEALAEILRPSLSSSLAAEEAVQPGNAPQVPVACHSRAEVEKAIRELRNLPVLASIASSFQAATREEQTPVQKIADLVRRDPGLNARILKMANSGLMRADHEIVEIEHAIVRLGTDRIRYMAQGLNTVAQLSKLSPQFEFRHLWSHSLACALLAEKLNEITRGQAETHIYSAALLHDVGKIVLASTFPEAYRQVLAGCAHPTADLVLRERECFGLDHTDAGLIFAQSHHFPLPIQNAIRAHSQPSAITGPEAHTVRLVAAANFFAKKYQMGFSGNPRIEPHHRQMAEDGESPFSLSEASAFFSDEEPDPWEIALHPFLPALREELDQLLALAYKKS